MSASVNKVILVGNVGQDPEVKYTQSGKAVANVSLATSYKSGDNEETEWHSIVLWDKLAEVAGNYITKGSPIYVEGRIKTRTWEDAEGVKKYKTEVVAERLQLLGGRDKRPDAEAEQAEAALSKPKATQPRGRKTKAALEADPFE